LPGATVPWSLFGWGAVTFIGAQLVHLPLLRFLTLWLRGVMTGPFVIEHSLVINTVILGLAAGLCEEGARWFAYRFILPEARSWPQGLMLDGVSVYASGHLSAPALEGVLACFGVASIAIVVALRRPRRTVTRSSRR
jgi:uncharacterized membrane protein YhfC